MNMLDFSLMGACFLIWFLFFIRSLNQGLDASRSINVKGIMTVAAVLMLGWPVGLLKLSGDHFFAYWAPEIPWLMWAMLLPLLLGWGMMAFRVFRHAARYIPPQNYIWPMVVHVPVALVWWRIQAQFALGDFYTPAVIQGFTFASAIWGASAVVLPFLSKQKTLIRLWHFLGAFIALGAMAYIALGVPHGVYKADGIGPIDQAWTQVPWMVLPLLLLPLLAVGHVWGAFARFEKAAPVGMPTAESV